MKERYFCTLFDAVRVMLPAGLHYQVACSYQAARDIPPEKLEALGDEEKRLIAYLSRCRLPVRRDKLLTALGYEADNDLPEHMSRQGYLEKIDDAFRKIGDAMVKMVRLTEKGETGGVKLSPKQREVFSLLQTVGAASVKEVCYFTGVTAGVVDAPVSYTHLIMWIPKKCWKKKSRILFRYVLPTPTTRSIPWPASGQAATWFVKSPLR